jgi:membrane-bound lytic murein transglycosylase B
VGRGRALARFAAVVVAVLAVAPPVGAQTEAAPIQAPDVGGGVPVGETGGLVDPSLARVAVQSGELRGAEAALRAAEAAIDGADAAIAAAEAAIGDAGLAIAGALEDQRRAREEVARREAVEREVQARIDRLSAEERRNARALEATRRRLQELAVASYVAGGDAMSFDALLSSESSSQYGRMEAYAEMADARLQDRITAYREARDAAGAAAKVAAGELEVARRETDAARQTVADAVAAEGAWRAEREVRVAALAQRVAERADRVAERDARVGERAEATVLAWVVGADFPLVVLDAYQRASVAAGQVGCAIPWWALAGIGRVESRHGTYLGGSVARDGQVDPAIIGIPLTGANGTAAVPDTDDGRYDGDPVHDRAVGPMQFIPSTWRGDGRDGDGDGDTDPNNLYDAAAAAAGYLCRAAGGDVATDAGMSRAFLAYNHSDVYVHTVLSYARAYAALRLPVG